MLGYSKIQIMGNVGGVPEITVLPSGESVVNFSVAVNRRFKDREGVQKTATDWYRIRAFNAIGENCARFLTRGSGVFVEGRLQVRAFPGKGGEPQVSVDIIPTTLRFLGTGAPRAEDEAPRPGQPIDHEAAEDAPF